MTNPLGTFTPRVQQTGDRLQARACIGRPILVQVTGFDGAKQTTDQTTKQSVVKPAVFVDVWDFLGGAAIPTLGIEAQPPNTVYIGAMWMSGPIVDNLKDFVGGPPMAVRITSQKSQKGYNFLSVVPLGDPQHDVDPSGPAQLAGVTQAFQADPTRFDRERNARAQAALAQQHSAAAQQSGFQPMAQPSAQAQQPGLLNGYPQGGFPGGVPQAMQIAQGTVGFQQPAAAPQYAQAQQSTPGQLVNAGQMSPADAVAAYQAQFQAPPGQPGALANTPAQVAQQWAGVDQTAQQQAPWNGQQMTSAAGPEAMAAAGFPAQGQAPQFQQPVQNGQAPGFPAQGFAQPNQVPAPAQGMPGGFQVNNGDVASILHGLGAAPQQ